MLKDDYAEEEILAANARAYARMGDDEDYEEFEDDWEDTQAIAAERAKLPGWFFMKIEGYVPQTFPKIEKWCLENCTHDFKKIGWHSGCSYTVAIAFEHWQDAMLYKLTFQG